ESFAFVWQRTGNGYALPLSFRLPQQKGCPHCPEAFGDWAGWLVYHDKLAPKQLASLCLWNNSDCVHPKKPLRLLNPSERTIEGSKAEDNAGASQESEKNRRSQN